MLDRVRHGTHHHAAKTCCDYGHEFTPENTYIRTTDGGRECRKCRPNRATEMIQRKIKAGDVCSYEDCDEPRRAKGLCKKHWGMERYAEKMATAEPCTKPGCDKPQFSGGLCSGHYKKRPRSHAQ